MHIDLHDMNRNEAIRFFVDKYNEAVKSGYRGSISIIHGYGSSGKGGVIKKELKDFLDSHKSYLEYEIDKNPGVTIVTPIKVINEMQDVISKEILEFCSVNSKSLDKVKGNFFKRYTNSEINTCVRRLIRQGYLTSTFKKNIEVFQAKGE